ncbi:MAG: NUDIX hydrolase [Steroidobacteraceae bacterium]|nr:NUDIX hydrolase [Steroidobacteraceae bacterium]
MPDKVRNVFKGRVLTVNLETVKLPNGRVAELEIAHHPGGAAVVALDAAGRVCLLRQFRHAAGGWIVEIPAGKLDGGEPPLDCGRRELAEEAGVTARRWDRLGEFLSSPGVLTEVIHVFLARELEVAEPAPEEHEVLEIQWVTLEKALKMAATGDGLRDGKTLIGLLWAGAALAAESKTGPRPPSTDS